MYKLLTIDVWDTLLRRRCHPECVKLNTSAHVFFSTSYKINTTYHTHWDLYFSRLEIEAQMANAARKNGGDDEYQISHVFENWLKQICDENIETLLINRLVEYELDTEIETSFADPEIGSFLEKYLADQTLFLSDFYMPTDMLSKILLSKGLASLAQNGISSCSVGLNKRSGLLYRHVHKFYGILPNEHMHVGDNSWSDFESASKEGVTGVLYLPTQLHAERLERESLFASRERLFSHLNEITIKASKSRADYSNSTVKNAFLLGCQLAPIFIGFSVWLAEKSLQNSIDRLYFMTREGEFFQRIYNLIFPFNTLYKLKLPPNDILEVSRLSTFVASMAYVSIEELQRIWRLQKSQKISALFSTLGLNHEEFGDVLSEVGLKDSDIIDSPSENESVVKLFRTSKFIDAVNKNITENRKCIVEFLTTKGIASNAKIGVVDIGWRGTIQDSLASILQDNVIEGFYLGLRKVINPQPSNVAKFAYGPNELIDTDSHQFFEAFSVMEMLCTSGLGSVESYSRVNDRVIPNRKISRDENKAFEQFTVHFQDGVALAAEIWAPYLASHSVTAAELKVPSMLLWEMLVKDPHKDLATTFMESSQHDGFGFGDVFQRDSVPSLKTILLSLFSKQNRILVLNFVRRLQWTSGVRNLRGLDKSHKYILILIFVAANFVKKWRNKTIRFLSKK